MVAAALHAVGNPIDAGGVAVTTYGVEPPLEQLVVIAIVPPLAAVGQKDPIALAQISAVPV